MDAQIAVGLTKDGGASQSKAWNQIAQEFLEKDFEWKQLKTKPILFSKIC